MVEGGEGEGEGMCGWVVVREGGEDGGSAGERLHGRGLGGFSACGRRGGGVWVGFFGHRVDGAEEMR